MRYNTNMYGGDPDGIVRILHEEFNRVGLEFRNTRIDMCEMAGYIHSNTPIRQANYGLIIEFECLEDEFRYLRPFVKDMEIMQYPTHRSQMMRLDRREFWDHNIKDVYETYTVCKCTMQFQIGGDNFTDFIHAFRKELRPLYEAAQSREFDLEVERMLTEDEYNS